MSRHYDILSTITWFCKENGIPREKVYQLVFDVECDAGQIVDAMGDDDDGDEMNGIKYSVDLIYDRQG